MLYEVNIDYKSFRFTDPNAAFQFAAAALNSMTENYEITIKLHKTKGEEDAAHLGDETED